MDVRIGRVYDPFHVEEDPVKRVLVDRLWPRGLSKARAELDAWLKEAAPSAELRRWYGHVPDRFPEFARRYREELAGGTGRNPALSDLRALVRSGPVVLLTATRDLEISGPVVLRDWLCAGGAASAGEASSAGE